MTTTPPKPFQSPLPVESVTAWPGVPIGLGVLIVALVVGYGLANLARGVNL